MEMLGTFRPLVGDMTLHSMEAVLSHINAWHHGARRPVGQRTLYYSSQCMHTSTCTVAMVCCAGFGAISAASANHRQALT